MCRECQSITEPIEKVARTLGHIPQYNCGEELEDYYTCSCGWKSKNYWDGEEFAFEEWVKHAQTVIGRLECVQHR